MKELQKILTEIGLSEITSRVYLALLGQKNVTAKQLATLVGIPRPSIYDHLKGLLKLGLVSELEIENKKYFQVDDPDRLEQLIEERIESLSVERARIKEIVPELLKGRGGVEARIKFFEGADGFRRALNDILWQDEREILALWPYQEMREVAGREYLKRFTERRIDQDIKLRAIWSRHGVPPVKIPKEEVRLAPKEMKWDMGYIICGDKVYFISSQKESFAFVIHSHDFAQMQKVQFEQIWSASSKK